MTGPAASQRLTEIESGQREPTRRQLVEMASKYSRPLLALYVSEPPVRGTRAHDRRTIKNADGKSEATLDAIIRDVTVRQALLRNALEDSDEADDQRRFALVESELSAPQMAARIIQLTKFELKEFRSKKTIQDAFGYARSRVQSLGIFVVLIGDSGHASRKVDPTDFRGLALPDPVVPFIVINDNDSRAAWSFTLFHELVHILMGQSAISGYAGKESVEQLCDDAASQLLLPASDLSEDLRTISFKERLIKIASLGRRFNISRKLIAYRLLRADLISIRDYQELSNQFDRDRAEFDANKSRGGADYFVVRRHRLGYELVRTVERMLSSGNLTSTKAALVLGVKPTAVGTLIDMAH